MSCWSSGAKGYLCVKVIYKTSKRQTRKTEDEFEVYEKWKKGGTAPVYLL